MKGLAVPTSKSRVDALLGPPVEPDDPSGTPDNKFAGLVDLSEKQPVPSGRPKPPPKQESLPEPADVRQGILSAYDRLNVLIKEAEKQLADLHTPVECQAVYAMESFDNGAETHFAIGWQKVGTDWRMCHASFDRQHPLDCEWRPLIECPADIRAEAVTGYAALRNEVIKAAVEYTQKVQKATDALAELLKKKS